MQRMLLTLVLLLPFGLALAGADNGQALDAPHALLRIERLQAGEAVCALVDDDGTYRLEKLFRAKAEMYTGKASNDEIEQLIQILENPQLRTLSQEKVVGEMISDTLDALDLAIWRQREWQTLSFHNPSSRKPFKDELDPLLRWFQKLQKGRPAAVKVEGAASRCVPAKELRQDTRKTDELMGAPAGSEAKYLFRFYSSEFARERAESNCTVVFADGTYRRETRFQPIFGSKTDRSYSGQVSTDSLAELKHLLDSPDLKKAHSDPGKELLAGDLEGSAVYIPRENEIQHLRFASQFNTHIPPLNLGGMSNMAYHIADHKVLDPLKHWVKQHTDKLEGGSETGKAVDNCFPANGK